MTGFQTLLNTLLSDPEGDHLDNVTRALHTIDTACSIMPDTVAEFAEFEREEAHGCLDFDQNSPLYDESFALLHACTALLMRSILASVVAGSGVPKEVKDRFNRTRGE